MQRRLLTLLFAFLLLGMQQEAQVHALTHMAGALQRSHEQGMQLPTADKACAECALLAGTSSVAPPGSATVPAAIVEFAAPMREFPSWTVAAPSYYSSRGPPALL